MLLLLPLLRWWRPLLLLLCGVQHSKQLRAVLLR
jgi:hypothetical protein